MGAAHEALVPMRLRLKRSQLAFALVLWATPALAQSSSDVTLWLWHGSHDLRGFVPANGEHVSVAYLSRTLIVEADGVRVTPRRDPIYLDPDMVRTAVVHMEIGRDVDASVLRRERAAILRALEPVFSEEAHGIQFDFDAPSSMRAEYEALLQEIAAAKPERWNFSMTALGSWCMQDDWLRATPVDFVVPMLFGPGHDRHETLAALERGPLPQPTCRDALGLREHQRPPRHHAATFFVFGQGSWNNERARAALESITYSSSSRVTAELRQTVP